MKTLKEVFMEMYPERVRKVRVPRFGGSAFFHEDGVDVAPAYLEWKKVVGEKRYYRHAWELFGDPCGEPEVEVKDPEEQMRKDAEKLASMGVYLYVDEETGESVWVKEVQE